MQHSNKPELKVRKITGKLKRTWFTKLLLDYRKRGQVGKKERRKERKKKDRPIVEKRH
jgi:hypothetical protein